MSSRIINHFDELPLDMKRCIFIFLLCKKENITPIQTIKQWAICNLVSKEWRYILKEDINSLIRYRKELFKNVEITGRVSFPLYLFSKKDFKVKTGQAARMIKSCSMKGPEELLLLLSNLSFEKIEKALDQKQVANYLLRNLIECAPKELLEKHSRLIDFLIDKLQTKFLIDGRPIDLRKRMKGNNPKFMKENNLFGYVQESLRKMEELDRAGPFFIPYVKKIHSILKYEDDVRQLNELLLKAEYCLRNGYIESDCWNCDVCELRKRYRIIAKSWISKFIVEEFNKKPDHFQIRPSLKKLGNTES